MNKLAHTLFPFNALALVDSFHNPKSISFYITDYCFTTAAWISNLPSSLFLLILLTAGGILPDNIQKLLSNHKQATRLQHQKNNGEWLSDAEFHEMINVKRTW